MKHLYWITGFLLALLSCACDLEERVPAEMASTNQSRPLGQEKSLQTEIRFDVGSLEISGEKSASLYSIDMEYDKAGYQPELKYDTAAGGEEGRLSVRLTSTHKVGIPTKSHGNRMRLNLADAVPVKLKINTGVGDARLSLSRLKLSSLDFDSGVGGAKVTSYEPNTVRCDSIRIKNGVGSLDATGLGNLNFRELEFEGGIGGANLDFTGNWQEDAEIRIQVGVGGVHVRMPRNVGVRVEAEKHFLSGIHLEGFTKRDTYYCSENFDKAKVRVTMRVQTGVGGFRITWA